MRAAIGDRIVVRGHKVGEHDRKGQVLAVEGKDGGPPYLVRWDDTGHEGLFFPRPDASCQTPPH